MADPLWTKGEAITACGGRPDGEMDQGAALSSVSIDTRTLEPDALYVAIRGDNLDGHDYVAKAFEAGAGAALVAEDAQVEAVGPLIRVADTLKGLERLGIAARGRTDAAVIAVTGSVGKTGTKEALRLALSASGQVHASDKSYNNHWGVPLSLANMARETRYGVFEVGMNHPGEIVPLTKMIRPHVAIVTTVEPVHLEFFKSVEQIAEAKAEIFTGLESGGTAILNRDNPHYDLLAARARDAGAANIVAFGAHDEAGARLVDMRVIAKGSTVRAQISGEEINYEIGAPGRHFVMNSLAVLAAVAAVGADLKQGAATLADYKVQKGRGAREVFALAAGPVMLIDESYNANPASMCAAFAALGAVSRASYPRRIVVLGDMLELGDSSKDLHGDLAGPVDDADVDVVFACGPCMHALFEALPAKRRGVYAATSQGLVDALTKEVRAGDVVMIKGSLGSKMALLVEAIREWLA